MVVRCSLVDHTAFFSKKRSKSRQYQSRRRLQQFGLPDGAFDALQCLSLIGLQHAECLEDERSLPLFAHVINTVLQNTFEENYLRSNLSTACP
jgi:hypothetical protein